MDENRLKAKRMGIDAQRKCVAYMSSSCHVCRAEGFNALSRVRLTVGERHLIADLNICQESIIPEGHIGLSEKAWQLLDCQPGQAVSVAHPLPLASMANVRRKFFGHQLLQADYEAILFDVVAERYSDVQLTAFLAAASKDMHEEEITALTSAMVAVGEQLSWHRGPVLDKHCVGGLPGNRTTPIVVAIVAANGFCMPKTSSRAITSPAGTADTMETMTQVDLSLNQMRSVVAREGACLVWGGAVNLSPADDILIRVERVLDIDSDAQLIASVLSKKKAAGAGAVLIDIPVGPTAKVRTDVAAERLASTLKAVGERIGLRVHVRITDGRQPIGRGIGPALEARDVLAVLQNRSDAPGDLRLRALQLAGDLLELGGVPVGEGFRRAEQTLSSGEALRKFLAICDAQGGFREPTKARFKHPVTAARNGVVRDVDNRILARLAKLAGAPATQSAGIQLHVRLGDAVIEGDPLFTLHADTRGELTYALAYLDMQQEIFVISEEEAS